MSNTRCKVICIRTSESCYGYRENEQPMFEADFCAVHGGSPENEQFFAATPTLTLKTGILKHQPFQRGKAYYLDFTEVE